MNEDARAQALAELPLALDAAAVDPPPPPGEVAVMRRDNAQFGEDVVRAAHAVQAFENPTDLAAFAYQDTNLLVAAREIKSERSYVLLAIGSDREGKREIFSAYRLYGGKEEVANLARDAKRCFHVFLERFAVPYKAKEHWALFTPVLIAKPGKDGSPMTTLGDIGDGRETVWNAQIRQSSDGTVTLAWPFVVNVTTYKEEINRNRR